MIPNVTKAIRFIERALAQLDDDSSIQLERAMRLAYQALVGADNFNDRCLKAIEDAATENEARKALIHLQSES